MRFLPAALWIALTTSAALIFVAVGWFVLHDRLDPIVEEAVVIVVERSGEFVLNADDLHRQLTGDLSVSTASRAAASCHSLLGHAGDWGVSPAVVISTRPTLVRVGELVATGQVDVSVATAIETVLFEISDEDLTVDEIAARTSGVRMSAIEPYLRLRRQPASTASNERFVGYVQNRTRTVQRLVIVDRDILSQFDFNDLPSRYSDVDLVVDGAPDQVSRADCIRLVSDTR